MHFHIILVWLLYTAALARGSVWSEYILIDRPITEVLGDQAKCDNFGRNFQVALQTATQESLVNIGVVVIPCELATMVNSSYCLARADFSTQFAHAAARVLARFGGWNAVRALGVVASTANVNLIDKTKDEGVEGYAVVIAAALSLGFSTLVATLCMRRSSLRRARSVKFKDLVRFELELTSDFASDGGVPLPAAR